MNNDDLRKPVRVLTHRWQQADPNIEPWKPGPAKAFKDWKRDVDKTNKVFNSPALPVREVNANTGRESASVNIPSPSRLNMAKNASAIRSGVEKAQTSKVNKSLAPSPLQDDSLLGKYDTRPKYSGRKFNHQRPTG